MGQLPSPGNSAFSNALMVGAENMVTTGTIAADRLRSFIERIERLEEEKSGIAADIREVFSEAKSAGFDIKVMRQLLKLRKMEPADRSEQEELLDLYRHAIGLD